MLRVLMCDAFLSSVEKKFRKKLENSKFKSFAVQITWELKCSDCTVYVCYMWTKSIHDVDVGLQVKLDVGEQNLVSCMHVGNSGELDLCVGSLFVGLARLIFYGQSYLERKVSHYNYLVECLVGWWCHVYVSQREKNSWFSGKKSMFNCILILSQGYEDIVKLNYHSWTYYTYTYV